MSYKIINDDAILGLKTLPDLSVNCCVTSPPYYGLRDYGCAGQIGQEDSPEKFVGTMVEIFREVRRVLRNDGTLWLNLGDSYSEKQLVGIPWRVALALQADGWHLRQDIIWHKPNAMPESVRDRCTKAHEYVFLLSKSARYYYDNEAIKEDAVSSLKAPSKKKRGGEDYAIASGLNRNAQLFTRKNDGTRNRRSVWSIGTRPFKGAHFATFPPDLIRPCILAGCPSGGIVLDPFAGSGTTLMVSEREGRNSIGIELNPNYIQLIEQRLSAENTDKKIRCESKTLFDLE